MVFDNVLEIAKHIANHESPQTTNLYQRRQGDRRNPAVRMICEPPRRRAKKAS
jgi:hypothetical protein